jgi:ParB/RepB/Spo0J family partition protein
MTAALPISVTAEQFYPTIAVDDLQPSATNPRKTFDPQRLAEMAKTIAEHGILEPILARPLPGKLDHEHAKAGVVASARPKFEIVAGERRWRAAKLAKVATVPVIVRPLNDKQALEIQTIENAQREDLHPLEQAAGYERLIKDFGYTPEKIADAIGKSRAHVFQVRKLGALAPKLREAFVAGEMDTTLATVLARVPGQTLQEAAWKKLKDEFRNGFSFRVAAEFIRTNFMLDLMRAPFNINDEKLVAKAGACGKCPKRTGNQVDLFPDVKNGNVCTDPACFAEKRSAATQVEIKQAEQKGREVIIGAQAKKIMPWQGSSVAHGSGFVEPSERCYDDAKRRTWKDLAKLAGVEPTLIQVPQSGELEPIIPLEKVKRGLAAKGIKLIRTRETSKAEQTYRKQRQAEQEKRARDGEARRRAWLAMRAKVKSVNDRDLRIVVGAWLDDAGYQANELREFWPFVMGAGAENRIAKLKPADFARFIVDLAVAGELEGGRYNEPANLAHFCKRYGVDLAKHRRAVDAEHKAKLAAAKKAKPKAKAKAKPVKKKGRK